MDKKRFSPLIRRTVWILLVSFSLEQPVWANPDLLAPGQSLVEANHDSPLRSPVIVSPDGFTPRQMEIIKEEVSFFIGRFAPQLTDFVDEIVLRTRAISVSQDKEETKKISKWFRWGAMGTAIISIPAVFSLWRSVKKGKMTRKQFLEYIGVLVLGIAIMAVPSVYLPAEQENLQRILGLFSPIRKNIEIPPQIFSSELAFRKVIAHEMTHFLGDQGANIFPRDSLLADGFAVIRILSLYGEEGLEQVYREGFRGLEEGEARGEYPRKKFFELGRRLYQEFPDPVEREKMLRMGVMRLFPGYSFIENPSADGPNPWTYLYGTATGAIAYELAQAHGGDVEIAWRYLAYRANGVSISQAEQLALSRGSFSIKKQTREELQEKIKPDLRLIIALLVVMAFCGIVLIGAVVYLIFSKIKERRTQSQSIHQAQEPAVRFPVTISHGPLEGAGVAVETVEAAL